MAVTDQVKVPIEGTMYYHLTYTADENTANGWVEVDYVTNFNTDEDPRNFIYYKKRTLQPAKKGIPQNTGSLTQYYTNYNDSLYKLAKDNTMVAVKIEVADNNEGNATEVFYMDRVMFNKRSIKWGNINEDTGSPVDFTIEFQYNSSHFYQPA